MFIASQHSAGDVRTKSRERIKNAVRFTAILGNKKGPLPMGERASRRAIENGPRTTWLWAVI
jgi:hypothetical protein